MSTLFIGCRVTYHGSITEAHGHTFLLLPCDWFADCENCGWEEASQVRYTLHDPAGGETLNHARAASITPHPFQPPEGAVPITIGEYHYLASHTAPGGSPQARIVYFHIADEVLGAETLAATWCRFPETTKEIRALDTTAAARATAGTATTTVWEPRAAGSGVHSRS